MRSSFDDLLEFVEHERDPPFPIGAELRGQLQQPFDRGVDVLGLMSGLEAESERAVEVERHHRPYAQPAEDVGRLLAHLEHGRGDVVVDRGGELLRELLLGRCLHQVDLGDEDVVVADQFLNDAPEQ